MVRKSVQIDKKKKPTLVVTTRITEATYKILQQFAEEKEMSMHACMGEMLEQAALLITQGHIE